MDYHQDSHLERFIVVFFNTKTAKTQLGEIRGVIINSPFFTFTLKADYNGAWDAYHKNH